MFLSLAQADLQSPWKHCNHRGGKGFKRSPYNPRGCKKCEPSDQDRSCSWGFKLFKSYPLDKEIWSQVFAWSHKSDDVKYGPVLINRRRASGPTDKSERPSKITKSALSWKFLPSRFIVIYLFFGVPANGMINWRAQQIRWCQIWTSTN